MNLGADSVLSARAINSSEMKVNGKHYKTIWLDEDRPDLVWTIDQRLLPHLFEPTAIDTAQKMHCAIADMLLRGAPLIGVAAAYGIYLAAVEYRNEANFRAPISAFALRLLEARPTAVNLRWAVDDQLIVLGHCTTGEEAVARLRENAERIANWEIQIGEQIGNHGLPLLKEIAKRKNGAPVNVLTHCNAGWLCAVDWGTATAPIYKAFDAGIPVHVWVDETRPRNQGASLTAWELGQHGVAYTLITDNAGGHLMQTGKVDIVIVGTDRTTRGGDVANKIGTYLKALAANDNGVPFYVAAPSSSIDWNLANGADIPIEERSEDEVKFITGQLDSGSAARVRIAPENARISNYGFDVTPRRLVTGIITERGIAAANEESLLDLFPEKRGVGVL